MLLTEEQAREKWCPEARLTEISDTGALGTYAHNRIIVGRNDHTPVLSGCLCIASRCMMWRWAEPILDGKNARQGYCGLAGGWHAHE